MNERVAPRTVRHVTIEDDLTDESFDKIAQIAHKRAGLSMTRTKKNMVKSRIVRRLRALRLSSFETYTDLVCSPEGEEERRNLIGALTTNVSSFFREMHHFDLMRTKVLPTLLERANRREKVRIWSAGCSNGQEPYSIAMLLTDMDPRVAEKDVRILATDIDLEVLAFARTGSYPEQMLEGVSPAYRGQYFETNPKAAGDMLVRRQIADMVTFKELNLHEQWPMTGPFDVIFCRNVLIYFDEVAQGRLLARFRDILAKDGWLMLGHSERVPPAQAAAFQSAGVTALRKSGI